MNALHSLRLRRRQSWNSPIHMQNPHISDQPHAEERSQASLRSLRTLGCGARLEARGWLEQ
jgi:hypothetical protein